MANIAHGLGDALGPLDGLLIVRLCLALLLCGAVGLERSQHDRASGLRTHILVGVSACLMTLAGAYGFRDLPNVAHDPTRIASYVVSGIGFLGAGAILRHGTTVRGLTTAASLWGAAGIGIAVGVGLGALAAITVGLILFTLVPLQRWEARWRRGDETRQLHLDVRNDGPAVGKTLAALRRLGVPIKRVQVLPAPGNKAVVLVDLARALVPAQVPRLVRRLLTLKEIEGVDARRLDEGDDGLRHAGDADDDEPAHLQLDPGVSLDEEAEDGEAEDGEAGHRGPLITTR